MDPTRRLPAPMVEQVRAFASSGRSAAPPRDAASVVLLRPGPTVGPGSLEVYLLRRHLAMAFAAGMAVFPGGGVDPRDFDHEVDWVGPAPDEWAALLGTDERVARGLVCAAVRETFEESGVLFAGTTDGSVVADTTGEDWEEDRRHLEARELAFTDFLQQRGLRLRTDLLRVWSAWLTPVFEPRRYRTWFFAGEVPSGQQTRDVSTESQEAGWLSVKDALREVDQERMLMLPPQYCICLELFDFIDPADAVASAAEREVALIEPTAQIEGESAYLVIPERLVRLRSQISGRIGS
jgi:8-oxo-dGTP pyrophosphatase MutT (NUDIX family)